MLAASTAAIVLIVASDARPDELSDLRSRIEVLEHLVAQLQGQLSEHDATKATTKSTVPIETARNEGLVFPAGQASKVRVRGLLHFDGRYFADDATPETANAWVLRRARPILQANLGDIGEVGFTPEFGGGRSTILDAFFTLSVAPWFRLTAGKFKVPTGLERIASAADLRFLERGLPSDLVPNRDLGAQLHGDVADGVFSYSVGYFNGVTDGGSSEGNTPTPDAENDASGDWAARFFVQPFLNDGNSVLRGLGFGLGATYVSSTGSATASLLPAYRTPGQQTFFEYRDGAIADGKRLRLAPQFYYHYGSFGMLGEAVGVSQGVSRAGLPGAERSEELFNTAWQLQFAWLATGEDEEFKGAVEPISPFSLDVPAWGAFEFVARYHALKVDSDAFAGGVESFADPLSAANKASAIGIGVNWYLNRYYKWSLNYERTRFDGGAANNTDRADEEFFSGRFAVAF